MMTQTRRKFIMAAAFGALIAAAPAFAQAPSGKLTLYTSQPEKDAAQTTAAFKKAYPSVEVDIFRSGTTEVMAKLAAEFAAGAAQRRRAADRRCRSMEIAQGQNRLLPIPTPRPTACRAGAFDADKTYFGSKLITTGIAYQHRAPR